MAPVHLHLQRAKAATLADQRHGAADGMTAKSAVSTTESMEP
jgi:hypothetical protein